MTLLPALFQPSPILRTDHKGSIQEIVDAASEELMREVVGYVVPEIEGLNHGEGILLWARADDNEQLEVVLPKDSSGREGRKLQLPYNKPNTDN